MSTATERLSVRLPGPQKALIDRAATLQGQTTSAFVVGALVAHAHAVVQAHEETRLSDRDRDVFLRLLEGEGTPAPALLRARERHSRLVRRAAD